MKELGFSGLIIFLAVMVGCDRMSHYNGCDPIFVVVKLISSESHGDKESARKYVDVESAYRTESDWDDYLSFVSSLNRSGKFTSSFPFHEFEFIQKISGESAIVSLVNHGKEYEINYSLELEGNVWMVKKIDTSDFSEGSR